VPVAVNTQLSVDEFAFMLADSRARAVFVSAPVLPAMSAGIAELPGPQPEIIVAGADPQEHSLAGLLAEAPAAFDTATTHPTSRALALLLGFDGPAGRARCTFIRLMQTAELYAVPSSHHRERYRVLRGKAVLRLRARQWADLPDAVGATSVLMGERPNTAAVSRVLREHQPTIFCGAPTLYNAMLASNDLPHARSSHCGNAFRREPLPQRSAGAGRRGSVSTSSTGRFDRDAAHLLSTAGEVAYGTTGRRSPVTSSRSSTRGEAGSARRKSVTCWSAPDQRCALLEQSRALPATFIGPWTAPATNTSRRGWLLRLLGRGDDMMKVSGMYVSPPRSRRR